MLSFEVRMTGGEIATQLSYDPEEFWYALEHLAECDVDDLGPEIAEHANDAGDVVVKFLRRLADHIEQAS